MQKKNWKIVNKYSNEESLLGILLENRGVKSEREKKDFLNPPSISQHLTGLSKEFKTSLKAAILLINESMEKKKPIVIHGDYDADGVCATALLYNTIKNELGYNHVYSFIPNRFEHGYGLSIKSVNFILEKVKNDYSYESGNVLFITVDSGITSVEEVSYLNSLGHKVILTDHHQKPKELPEAECILWNDEIVGSTISWILSKGLGSKDKKSLSLACLATVTDLQPLHNFNRSIVKNGLEILNTDPPYGLKKLLEVSGKQRNEITTYELGWVLGPRLNASGRMEDASDSLEILIETDRELIDDIAIKLNSMNIERQNKTLEMYELATDFSNLEKPKIIISSHENYHEGIIGLVAAKLVQKYYCPAIVVSLENGVGKGSVRSVKGIDIIAVLRKFEDLFINVGGHPMAAGFQIDTENIPALEASLLSYAEKEFDDELLVPIIEIDAEIPIDIVELSILDELDKLKPFGLGNDSPKFVSRDVSIFQSTHVGNNNQHWSLKFYDGDKYYKGIFFNGMDNEWFDTVGVGDKVDIVYRLKRNEYKENTYVDLQIIDLRKVEN